MRKGRWMGTPEREVPLRLPGIFQLALAPATSRRPAGSHCGAPPALQAVRFGGHWRARPPEQPVVCAGGAEVRSRACGSLCGQCLQADHASTAAPTTTHTHTWHPLRPSSPQLYPIIYRSGHLGQRAAAAAARDGARHVQTCCLVRR